MGNCKQEKYAPAEVGTSGATAESMSTALDLGKRDDVKIFLKDCLANKECREKNKLDEIYMSEINRTKTHRAVNDGFKLTSKILGWIFLISLIVGLIIVIVMIILTVVGVVQGISSIGDLFGGLFGGLPI